MVKLRGVVTGHRIDIRWTMFCVANTSNCWNGTTTAIFGPSSPLIGAYLSGRNAIVLLLIADVMHTLKLTVSFEVLKRETGLDFFDSKNKQWAIEEINLLRGDTSNDDVWALVD